MDERIVAGISVVPVVIEATTRVPAFFEQANRFAEMMAKYPPGVISTEVYMNKLGEALGPDVAAGVLLALGTFITFEIGIHVISAIISRGAEAIGNVVDAAASGDDNLGKPVDASRAHGASAQTESWVYRPSSDEQMAQKVVKKGHERARKAMRG